MRIELVVDYLDLEDGRVIAVTGLEGVDGEIDMISGVACDTEDEAYDSLKETLFPAAPKDLSELV